ncbi:MAG: hypothetical protein ABSE62_12180 [Chthoniobacteraceae bacterium]
MNEDDQDVSRRYWKAAISALPTAEKRDAAWEFYLDKLTGANAGDTLSGLILLLEANGAFLLTLPAKFHEEMTLPIIERLSAMREELQANVEGQRAALRAADAVNEGLEKANKQFAATTAVFALKVRAAAAQIDTGALASQVYCSLHSSIAIPLRNELRALPEQSKRIDEASKAAESSIEKWHKIHFGGILANCMAFAAIITLILTGLVFWGIRSYYDRRLAGEIVRLSGDDEAYRRLLALGITMRVAPWTDADGEPVQDGYTLVVRDAEDAQIKESGGHKEAVTFVKANGLQEQLDDIERHLRAFEQLSHSH